MKSQITVFSHGFRVIVKSIHIYKITEDFNKRMSQWGFVKEPPRWRPVRKIIKSFIGKRKGGRECWYTRYALDEFVEIVKRSGLEDSIEITYVDPPEGLDVVYKRNDVKPPRDKQPELISKLSRRVPLTVTNLQTGKGKSLCSLEAMKNIGKRAMFQMKGGYIDKWIGDVNELFDLENGDLLVVRGANQLSKLIQAALEGRLKAKIIYISNRTIHSYLKAYETGIDFDYDCEPHELCEVLNIGLRVIDEVHEDFHLHARSNIYLNVKTIIALSATLETDDNFLKGMYRIFLPYDTWHNPFEYDAYCGSVALFYQTQDKGKEVSTMPGSTNYSHAAYEEWIFSNSRRRTNYLTLIASTVKHYFFDKDYASGMKCIIFCSRTEVCKEVSESLQNIYPDLAVDFYISETDFKVLHLAEIIVTTVESCGTAQDIPNVKTIILTRNIKRREKNEQIKGRARKLADFEGVTPVLVYFVNTDIKKHMDYHIAKLEQFKGKVKYHTTIRVDRKV